MDYQSYDEIAATDNQNAPQSVSYQYSQTPYTVQGGAAYTAAPKAKKKKKHFGAGLIALMLALCLVSGAAGSGLTAMLNSVTTSRYTTESDTANDPIADSVSDEAADTSSAGDTVTITNAAAGSNVINTSVETGTVLTVAEIAAVVSPAVVSIDIKIVTYDRYGRTSQSSGSGSGIIISEDGYILTNNHVIEDASTITVTLSTGKAYTARLIGADSQTDLAVLKIDGDNLPYAILGDSDSLQPGDLAVAIGNPLGTLANTVTTGIISATDREITIDDETMNLLQTDAAINPGNSGGALCNQYGEVIGVVNAKTSATGIEGLGFAIPINDAKPVIVQLIENGYVTGRASFGFSTQEITSSTAMFYRAEAGIYVSSVTSGGAADLAGIKSGDRIISIDGQTIDSVAALKAIKEQHSPGDILEIVVKRNGQTLTLSITLQEEK